MLPAHAAYNSEVDVDANIAYLISLDKDNTVIYDKNSSVRFSPAAIVKIVTGILVIENCDDLDRTVTADHDSVYAVSGTGSTTAGIYVGEEMTVRELLYCALVYNAGDAASILATFIGGDTETFVGMMNDFAARLGCANTHFVNPVGYDQEGQYTTARELAAIYYYCVSNSTFEEIIATDYYEIEPTNMYGYTRYLKTTNGLMNTGIPDYYFKYVKSGKSGVTDDDRCNSVSVASKDGYNYLCVIMDSGYTDFDNDGMEENMALVSAKKLYEWTFDNIKLRVVASPSTYVAEIPVKLSSEYDYVSLVPAEEISALVPSGVSAESLLPVPIPETMPDYVKAPIKKGDIIGRAAIKYAGETVAEVDLAAAFDVNSNLGKWFGDLLWGVLKSTVFRIIFLVALVVGVVFFLIAMRNGRLERKKNSLRLVKGGAKPRDPKER
ncbi:MAG: D-alanyl-D-alanine carboxypeptidase [Clostridia bacterium]|nr:D-alanyl-D-alanine carboxypeptidase [Clostridia bacterium]